MELVKQALKLSTSNRRIFLESQRVLKGQILRGDMVIRFRFLCRTPFCSVDSILAEKREAPVIDRSFSQHSPYLAKSQFRRVEWSARVAQSLIPSASIDDGMA
jgi:hypothetical protein